MIDVLSNWGIAPLWAKTVVVLKIVFDAVFLLVATYFLIKHVKQEFKD